MPKPSRTNWFTKHVAGRFESVKKHLPFLGSEEATEQKTVRGKKEVEKKSEPKKTFADRLATNSHILGMMNDAFLQSIYREIAKSHSRYVADAKKKGGNAFEENVESSPVWNAISKKISSSTPLGVKLSFATEMLKVLREKSAKNIDVMSALEGKELESGHHPMPVVARALLFSVFADIMNNEKLRKQLYDPEKKKSGKWPTGWNPNSKKMFLKTISNAWHKKGTLKQVDEIRNLISEELDHIAYSHPSYLRRGEKAQDYKYLRLHQNARAESDLSLSQMAVKSIATTTVGAQRARDDYVKKLAEQGHSLESDFLHTVTTLSPREEKFLNYNAMSSRGNIKGVITGLKAREEGPLVDNLKLYVESYRIQFAGLLQQEIKRVVDQTLRSLKAQNNPDLIARLSMRLNSYLATLSAEEIIGDVTKVLEESVTSAANKYKGNSGVTTSKDIENILKDARLAMRNHLLPKTGESASGSPAMKIILGKLTSLAKNWSGEVRGGYPGKVPFRISEMLELKRKPPLERLAFSVYAEGLFSSGFYDKVKMTAKALRIADERGQAPAVAKKIEEITSDMSKTLMAKYKDEKKVSEILNNLLNKRKILDRARTSLRIKGPDANEYFRLALIKDLRKELEDFNMQTWQDKLRKRVDKFKVESTSVM